METAHEEFRYEDLTQPEVKKFLELNQALYGDGMMRVWPSGCALFKVFQNHLDTIRKLNVRPDDVWIVTYPKCGTTWTQEMVWLLLNDFDYDTAKSVPQPQRSPFMEFGCFLSDEMRAKMNKDTLRQTETLKSPRCIKSHLPLQLLPEQLWTVKPKIIYVAREPKDVLVSFYHHHRLWCGFQGSCEDFAEAFIGGYVLYGSIWDHIQAFWNIPDKQHVLFNTFEEMKKDLPNVVRRTARFLNCSLNDGQLKELCDHLSFESMKNNPMVSHEEELAEIPRGTISGRVEPFIRKGEVGGWKSDMSPALANNIDNWTQKKLNGYNYM